jgi:hypothetical protein
LPALEVCAEFFSGSISATAGSDISDSPHANISALPSCFQRWRDPSSAQLKGIRLLAAFFICRLEQRAARR